MTALKYLSNVISGKRKYWNKIHDPVLDNLWKELECCEGRTQVILKHLTVAAVMVVEDLMSMGDTKGRFFKIDCRSIDKEQFLQLYIIILSYFLFLIGVINRKHKRLAEELRETVVVVTKREKLVQRTFQKLSKRHSKSKGELSIGKLGGTIWDEIVEVVEVGDRLDLQQFLYFSFISQAALVDALKRIKEEFGN